MKVKKWLLGFMTFAAMAVLCVVCAGAEIYGDFDYELANDGTAMITGYHGNAKEVKIPDTINGHIVTRIEDFAFGNESTIEKVTIPEKVDTIFRSFYNCSSLKSINIPDGVKWISDDAFHDCVSLESIEIPGNIERLNIGIFAGCTSLTKMKINEGVKEIYYYSNSIRYSAPPSLTNVEIPDSVSVIQRSTFSDMPVIENQKSDIKYIGKWIIECDKTVTSAVIKNGTVGIAESAFSNCSIVSINIPESVRYIGKDAFSNTTITESQETPEKYVGKWVVECNSDATSISIKKNTVGIADSTFESCYSLSTISLPDSIKYIGDSAFSGTSIETLDIPKNCEIIGSRAFEYADIISLNIPEGITRIESHTFDSCGKLETITIPASVHYIGEGAFEYCRALKKINIPYGVTKIESYTFSCCDNLQSVYIPDSVKIIDGYAFYNCGSLSDLRLSTHITSIGTSAFEGCGSLKKITMPVDLISIGSSAFLETSLVNITIPSKVKSIGDWAFLRCKSLTNVNAPDSLLYIGNAVFADTPFEDNQTTTLKYAGKWIIGCDESATNVKIGEEIVGIAGGAFSSCEALVSINIPDNVMYICSSAFWGCTSLESVRLPNYLLSIYDSTFIDCDSLQSITIPNSVLYIDCYGYHTNPMGYQYEPSEKWGLEFTKKSDFKIYCYSDTAGERYAKRNYFEYEILDCEKHSYGSWKTIKSATYISSGFKSRICSNCGKVETATIAKLTLAKVTGAKLGGRAADALRINWTKNASADGYIVEMYQNGKWARVGKITSNNTTTFRKAGLKAGTAYKFRVKAYKMSGKTAVYSAYSAELAARTNPSVIKDAKLGGRAADALRINWSKNTSADGYIVEMYQGNKWVRVAKITNNSTTTFRKAGLKASTVYKFRVRAYKMSGSTALYGNYSATVTARTNPSIMKGVKIGGKAKDALRVNWTKNTSAQGYIVEMYKGGKWVRVAKITNSNTTTFRKAGLAKNTAYKFRVRAYHMSGKTALYGNYGNVSGRTLVR